MYLSLFKELNSSSNTIRVNQKNTEIRLFKITGHRSVVGQYEGKPTMNNEKLPQC